MICLLLELLPIGIKFAMRKVQYTQSLIHNGDKMSDTDIVRGVEFPNRMNEASRLDIRKLGSIGVK